ncbi:MAG: asparaginase [Phascolarctobacterium sp.]|nr:asparaginase [Phascolarctobacterium sp.]
MKKILMIGTGGTIASVPGPDGLVPALDGQTMCKMVSGLANLCAIECKEILNLDSSNLSPRHWQQMAVTIAENYEAYDGFVITHGTDTMAYSAAALSIIIQNSAKPIVLTGAQLPIGTAASDAPNNILLAFKAAASDVPGVMLAFDKLVIAGSCAKKMCSQNFAGFFSINRQPLGIYDEGEIVWSEDALKKSPAGKFVIHTNLEEKVAVIKLMPGLTSDVLDYYVAQGYKGLIIESFGAGGVPNAENNWLFALEKTIQAGVKVVCATQCVYDGVHLDTYPIGSLAKKLGAESAGNDTIEYSYAKLMWDLAN